MSAFDLDIELDPNYGAVTGSSVRANTPDTTLGSTSRYSTDVSGVARTPQPQHLSANLGLGSVAPFEGATAAGAYAAAKALGCTAVGYHAIAKVHQATALGNQSQAIAYRTLAAGSASIASAIKAIALGVLAYAPFANSIALGYGARTTAANQLNIPSTVTDLQIAGRIISAPVKSLTNNTTTELFRIAMPLATATGFQVTIGLTISDGTNTIGYSDTENVSAIHDGSGYAATMTSIGATTQLGSGGSVLVVTVSMTQPSANVLAFNIKSNTTVITPTSTLCYYQIANNGGAVVSLV